MCTAQASFEKPVLFGKKASAFAALRQTSKHKKKVQESRDKAQEKYPRSKTQEKYPRSKTQEKYPRSKRQGTRILFR
jgi:hypothetical protein